MTESMSAENTLVSAGAAVSEVEQGGMCERDLSDALNKMGILAQDLLKECERLQNEAEGLTR